MSPFLRRILCLLLSFVVLGSAPWQSFAIAVMSAPDPEDDNVDLGFSSTSLASPPSQSQCWVDALKIFQPTNQDDIEGSTKLCEHIGHHQKKALAFELARCHLQDLGRAIINPRDDQDILDPHNCTVSLGMSERDHQMQQEQIFPNLSKCLSYLTDAGANAYTHFFAQVVQLCNRLTQHSVIDFQQRMAAQLAKISQQAAAHLTRIINRHEDAFTEREQTMKEQQEDFYATMQRQQQRLWQDQNHRIDTMQSWAAKFLEDWQQRDHEQKARQEAWLYNQTLLIENRTSALERQHQEMKKLSEGISATSILMQPVVALEAFVSKAKHGYTLLMFLLHFLAAFNVTWLVTRPRLCEGFRGWLFALVVIEKIAEICVFFSMNDNSALNAEKMVLISTMRSTAVGLETIIYFSGLLLCACCSCCWSREDEDEDEDYDDDDNEYYDSQVYYQEGQEKMIEELKRAMDETIAKATRRAPEASNTNIQPSELPLPPNVHRSTTSEPSPRAYAGNEVATSPVFQQHAAPEGGGTVITPVQRSSSDTRNGGEEVKQVKPNETTTITTVVNDSTITSVATARDAAQGPNATDFAPQKASPKETNLEAEPSVLAMDTTVAPDGNKKRTSDEISGGADEDNMSDDDEDSEARSEASSPTKRRRTEMLEASTEKTHGVPIDGADNRMEIEVQDSDSNVSDFEEEDQAFDVV